MNPAADIARTAAEVAGQIILEAAGTGLGEESGPSGDLRRPLLGGRSTRWHHELHHGFPVVGVSVALVQDGAPVAGAIHAPFLAQTYVAGAEEGAWLTQGLSEPQRLRVSDREPHGALVATGFPFRRKNRLPRDLRALTSALERFEDLRRPGAASLDLAWTRMVTDWNGGTRWLEGDILAGSPAVVAGDRSRDPA